VGFHKHKNIFSFFLSVSFVFPLWLNCFFSLCLSAFVAQQKKGQSKLPPFEETEKARSYLFLKLDEKTFIWFQKTFQIIVWLV